MRGGSKRVDFDDYSDDYDGVLKRSLGVFGRDLDFFVRRKVEIVKSHIENEPSRILEYGCGTGRNLAFLAKAFPNADIVGYDVSKSSMDAAKEKHPELEFCFDHKDLSNSKPFDLIVVAGVIHHVNPDKYDEVFYDLNSLLTLDGSLFIFEHNPFNPVTRRIVSNCEFDVDAILISKNSLISKTEQHNLKAEGWGYFLFLPWVFFSRVESVLSKIPLGGQYWIQFAKRCGRE